MTNQKIITITGRSDSGKTTLIERLVKKYTGTGITVSVIKSMKHDFDIDYPGKDSFRYREAGSTATAITNGSKFAIMSRNSENLSPLEIAEKYFPDSDVILIEGFKEGTSAKIEVIGESSEDPLYLTNDTVKLIVTDKDITTDLPCFKRDDIDGIFTEIERLF